MLYTTGLHNISVTVINQYGCDSSFIYQVLVDSLPKPVINASDFSGCAPLSVSFTGNAVTPGTSYRWIFGDGTASYNANPSHTWLYSGNYSVKLIAMNSSGCSDSVTASILVHPSPSAFFKNFVSTDHYTEISSLELQNLSSGAVRYIWDFGNGDTSNAFEPRYEYRAPGRYTIKLMVVNSFGCTDIDQASIEIKVPEDLYIPNAFTPNGDGRNTYFSVKGRNVVDLTVRIYNRWGQLLYTSNNIDFQWDGTFHGKQVQEDVYVYKISATGYHGKSFEKTGTVTVIK
jgi:gliding motility-associated-like protein